MYADMISLALCYILSLALCIFPGCILTCRRVLVARLDFKLSRALALSTPAKPFRKP